MFSCLCADYQIILSVSKAGRWSRETKLTELTSSTGCVFKESEGVASPSGEEPAEGRHTVLTLRLAGGFKFARARAPAAPPRTDLAASALHFVFAV